MKQQADNNYQTERCLGFEGIKPATSFEVAGDYLKYLLRRAKK
jgi:hypothetical protein